MRLAAIIQIVWRNAILVPVLLVMVTASASAAGRVPYGQGILWKIEQPGGAPNYLLGTMHVNDPRVRNLPAPVRSAFNNAERSVFEIVLTPDVRRQMSAARYLPEGRALEDILDPDLFNQAASLAETAGVNRDTFRRLKPWAAAMAFTSRQDEFARFSMGEQQLDQWMQSNAQNRGIPVLELETVEEHMAVFDGMSEADQIELLRGGIEDAQRTGEQRESMIQFYVSRDTGALYTLFYDDIDADGSAFARRFAERLIDNRNHAMVDRMQDLLRQGGTFIAVGALHLPGDQGILRLLQRQGYSIVREY